MTQDSHRSPNASPVYAQLNQGIEARWAHHLTDTPRFTRAKLYPLQAALVDDPNRFTICEASSKAGKTMGHLEWLLEESIKTARGNWWWVATTSDTADIAYRRAKDRLRGFVDSSGTLIRVSDPVPFQQNETRKIISVAGATLWFKSAEKPDNLYGEDVYGAVGDEVTRWRQDAWTALYSTLTATRGRAKLIGNAKGRRNWAYLQARKAEAGEADWGYHKLTARDAVDGGVLDAEIIEQARRDLPEATFRELYMAEAADDGSNPFGLAAIREAIIPASSIARVAAWGADLAKSSDYTWVIGLDADGSEVVSQRWQAPWSVTLERLQALSAAPMLLDSTGVGDPILEQLQKMRPDVTGFKFSSGSKQQLMEGLASAIQQNRVAYADPLLVLELESFEFEYSRTGVKYSAPPGLHDDGVCALALAVRLLHRPAVHAHFS